MALIVQQSLCSAPCLLWCAQSQGGLLWEEGNVLVNSGETGSMQL